MRITHMRRSAACAAAGAVALTAFMGLGAGSALALSVQNATTSASALPGEQYGDVTQTGKGLGLVCVPGKAEYLVSYRGNLDMVPVVTAWNNLKDRGRDAFNNVGALIPDIPDFPTVFNELKVSGDFQFTFTVDKNVVDVDMTKLVDHDAWDAAYKAANDGTVFPNQMVVDRSKTPTHDAATGKVTVFFKLADGLTAGEMDNTYNAQSLKALNIDSMKGLFKVSKAHFKAVDESAKNFLLTEPTVTGTFNKPVTPRGGPLGQAINNTLAGAGFPIAFGQPAAEYVKLVTTSTYALATSYASSTGEALPAEVMATLPAGVTGQAQAADMVTSPAAGDTVVVGNDTWTFEGWNQTAAAWNDDPAMSSDCYLAQAVGTWSVTKAEAPKPPMEEGKPAPKDGKPGMQNPKIARTGSDALVIGGASAAMLLAGAGAVALRRRNA